MSLVLVDLIWIRLCGSSRSNWRSAPVQQLQLLHALVSMTSLILYDKLWWQHTHTHTKHKAVWIPKCYHHSLTVPLACLLTGPWGEDVCKPPTHSAHVHWHLSVTGALGMMFEKIGAVTETHPVIFTCICTQQAAVGRISPPQTLLKLEQEYKEIWLPLHLHFIYNVGSCVCKNSSVCLCVLLSLLPT